jgi:hypothetical protein
MRGKIGNPLPLFFDAERIGADKLGFTDGMGIVACITVVWG